MLKRSTCLICFVLALFLAADVHAADLTRAKAAGHSVRSAPADGAGGALSTSARGLVFNEAQDRQVNQKSTALTPDGNGRNDAGGSVGDSDPPINIHLTWNDNSTDTTMVITWATLTDVETVVKYGLTESYDSQRTGSSVWSSACRQYIHTVKLTGLAPVTPYHYCCGSSAGGFSEDFMFTTGVPAGGSERFIFSIGGDSRNPDDTTPNPTYAAYRISVMNTILSCQPQFAIHLGDIPNRGQYQPQWDEIFDNLKPQFTTMPYMPCWGSHGDPHQAQNAFDQFVLPLNGTGAGKEEYYSFDYGKVHFTVLYALWGDSRILPGSPQYKWLEHDLNKASYNPKIEWKFVCIHSPPYSTATRSAGGSNLGLRSDICPMLDQYKVDIVFTAHEHHFERTHLIRNDTKVQDVPSGSGLVDPNGRIYYISGGLGGPVNPADGNEWFSAHHANVRHFLLVDVNDMTVNVKAIAEDLTLVDELTMSKSPTASEKTQPPPRRLGGLPMSKSPTAIFPRSKAVSIRNLILACPARPIPLRQRLCRGEWPRHSRY
ncbi:MAG: metallophosphoesterase family protein [Phycisphaerales bacterium]|nr:MAG: metallophosphoesterase family protein [Phycisphaerales bacterium]